MGKAGERGSPGIPGVPGAKVSIDIFVDTLTDLRDFSEDKAYPDYQGVRAYKANLVFKAKLELLVPRVQLAFLVGLELLVMQVYKVQPALLAGLVSVENEAKKAKP